MFASEYTKNNLEANSAESCLVKDYFRFRLEEREELLKIITGILQKNHDLSKNIKDLEMSIEKYYKYGEVTTPNNSPKF